MDKNVIEEVKVIRIRNLQRDFIIQSLPNFTNMHTLELRDINDAFAPAAECISLCGNLNSLSINTIFCFSEENLMNAVFNLKNLTQLTINNMDEGTVTKKFIDFISCNLKELRYLDLSSLPDLNYSTESFLKSISNLAKLEVLKINALGITGSELGTFPNLKELHCSSNRSLEDDFFIRVLRSSNKLEFLDIKGCDSITNSVINVAIEETKKRTNNVLLEIHHDQINFNEINNNSPLLNLVTM